MTEQISFTPTFNDWVYDLETYPNIFTFATIFANGKGKRVFEISNRRNEADQMLDFLHKVITNKHRLVGFNNVGFDYPVIHFILEKAKRAKATGKPFHVNAREIYTHVEKMFAENKDNRFGSMVKSADVMIPQVDLFKIHHFDNKARMTSLKLLEFNMRSKNIEDLPFPVGKVLTDDEMDVLIDYNHHDVFETLKFYHHSMPAIELRSKLTEAFGFDCTNFNDTKIGKELFVQRLEKNRPGCCYKQGKFGRKMMQTKRDSIALKDCILSYTQFDRPEFQAIHKWLNAQVITETKGVFSDIEEHLLGDVAKYAEMKLKFVKINDPADKNNKRYVPTQEHVEALLREHPMGWIETKELKSPKGCGSYYLCWNIAETLNVVINGFRYDFGTGGIHGCKKGMTISGNGKIIKTIDVASYYPNLSIRNRLYPEHLDVLFCDVYLGLFNERRSYDKKNPMNAALKLALNGTYGASNDEYSPMYDPKFTMSITINGQLSLCMLMERMINEIGAEIIMCNTDGFEYVIDEAKEEAAEAIVKEWEALTKLEMEGDTYATMMAANVNNYIAVYKNGDVKYKGAYVFGEKAETENGKLGYVKGLEWHKNQSALVVKMAAAHELLGNGCAEDFIRGHKDPFDFMLRTKVPRSSSLVIVDEFGVEEQLQNICRYYPSVNGGKLIKIMPPLKGKEHEGNRRLSIDADWNVTPCNDMDDFKWGVNYDYYITEARKLIDAIHGDFELDGRSEMSDDE